MLLQAPITTVTPTVDALVLQVLASADTEFTAPRVHGLAPLTASLSGVRNSLNRLARVGVVTARPAGAATLYSLNREHLAADAIIALAGLKAALIQRIKDLVDGWEIRPTYVALFGSAARPDMSEASDIDVFLLFPDDLDEDLVDDQVSDLADRVTRWTGNDTRPLVYAEHELAPSPIFDSVLREGLTVTGSSALIRKAMTRGRKAS